MPLHHQKCAKCLISQDEEDGTTRKFGNCIGFILGYLRNGDRKMLQILGLVACSDLRFL